MERIKLKDPGLYGMEMQKRIDESEDEGYRTYVVAVDDVLATYRETVAADQVKKAPSGNRYWTPEQLEWRRQEHAAAAWATIQAMPQLQQLDTVISDLQGRLEKRGIPIHTIVGWRPSNARLSQCCMMYSRSATASGRPCIRAIEKRLI